MFNYIISTTYQQIGDLRLSHSVTLEDGDVIYELP